MESPLTSGRSGLKVSPLCLGTMMLGRWGNTWTRPSA